MKTKTPRATARGVGEGGGKSGLGTSARALEQERGENEDAPSVPDACKRANPGHGADETAIPQEHERPRQQEANANEQDDDTDNCEEDSDYFIHNYLMLLMLLLTVLANVLPLD